MFLYKEAVWSSVIPELGSGSGIQIIYSAVTDNTFPLSSSVERVMLMSFQKLL